MSTNSGSQNMSKFIMPHDWNGNMPVIPSGKKYSNVMEEQFQEYQAKKLDDVLKKYEEGNCAHVVREIRNALNTKVGDVDGVGGGSYSGGRRKSRRSRSNRKRTRRSRSNRKRTRRQRR